jgi:DNA anti-recombination protein RmuC
MHALMIHRRNFAMRLCGVLLICIAAATYPQELSRERQAAVEQIASELTKLRQDLLQDLDQREQQLQKIFNDAQRLVNQVDRTGNRSICKPKRPSARRSKSGGI